MTKAEELFETAKQLMALQSKFGQQIRALEHDEATEKAMAHMLIAEAIDLASSMYETFREGNKAFLNELVEKGSYTYADQYINGCQIEGKAYSTKPVKGYEILNKEDPKVWSVILMAAAKNDPEVIQKRVTDSRVTPQFLEDCAGLIAVKTTDDYTWSVKKAK